MRKDWTLIAPIRTVIAPTYNKSPILGISSALCDTWIIYKRGSDRGIHHEEHQDWKGLM